MFEDTSTAQVSIAPPAPIDEIAQVSIAPQDTPPPIDSNKAALTTVKAKYGVPSLALSHDEMFKTVIAGQEENLRKQAAALIDMQTAVRKQQVFNELAQKQTRPFSPIEAQTIKQFMDTKETDPNSVFEEFYSKNYMENLRKAAEANPNSALNEAKILNPKAFEHTLNVGVDLKAKKEFLESVKQKLEDQHGGVVSTIFNFAKYAIPFYNEYNLRGVTGDYKSLLGTNLDRVASDLYSLPYDQFKAKVTNIVDKLTTGHLGGNPMLAVTFLQHATDPDVSATIIDNLFSTLDLSAWMIKPAMLASKIKSARAEETMIKRAISDMVNAPDPFNPSAMRAGQTFNPVTFGPGTASTTSFMGTMMQNVDKAITEQARTFRPERGLKPTSMSITSFMDGMVKNIEVASQKFEFKNFRPETWEAKAASTTSFMEDMLKRVEVVAHEAAGNIPEAGVQSATRELTRNLTEGISASDNLRGLQSSFNKRLLDVQGDTRGSSQEFVNRIMEKMVAARDALTTAVTNSIKVDRIPAVLAVEKHVRDFTNKIRGDFPGVNNQIMDVSVSRVPVTGGIESRTVFGKDGTRLFSRERDAGAFIDQHGFSKTAKIEPVEGVINVTKPKGEAAIEHKGSGFQVVVTKPEDETHPVIRNALLSTAETRTPHSWANAWGGYLGGLRTPEETLAREQNLNRHVASYGPSVLRKVVKETAEDIDKLKAWTLPKTGRQAKWEQWKQAIGTIRTDEVDGRPTNTFRTIGEIKDFYQNTFHRLPDEQEIAATFAYQNQGAALHELSKLRERSEKLRVGAQTFTIRTGDPATETAKSARGGPGTLQFNIKAKFSATKLQELPTETESIFIVGQRQGEGQVRNTQYFAKTKAGKLAAEELQKGERVLLKLTNPEENPLHGFEDMGQTRPKYVLTYGNFYDTAPLEWDTSVRKLFLDHDYDHYVAQPKIKRDPISGLIHYDGDTHIGGFNIRAMGQDVAGKLDDIRQFLKMKNEAGARLIHEASKIPMDFDEVKGWFNSGKLSLDDKITLVPHNRNVNEMDKALQREYGPVFRDNTAEISRNERAVADVFTLDNKGTKENPLYERGTVKYVDPITTMNRSINRVINEAYLNDYKIFSVEHWIQEAKEHLNISDASLASSPTYFFYNPIWKQGAPVEVVNNLMTAQMQIKQFLGIQDKTSTYLHAAAQELRDSIYAKSGQKMGEAMVPLWAIPMIRDPFVYVRSMAFNMLVGLFALPQLWVQAQTFVNITGIAGAKMASAGTKAALLHAWSAFSKNPDILEHLDGLATKSHVPGMSNWLPGHWKEAHDIGVISGFFNVAGEHALRDNPFGSPTITNGFQSFLKAGQIFFRKGEEATRIGAWYTAYKEFRDINPTGVIGNTEMRQILDRADLLTMNMSRASNSMLHQGVLSIPAQFLTYQLRTAELFLGKRLTSAERARLFGVNALMYGLPTAFGLSGIPFGDWIKKAAIEDGYVIGDNYINDTVTQGLPALIIALSTGQWTNFGERFGVQGFQGINDILRGDKTVLSLLGGAGGNVLANSIASMDGFYYAMKSLMNDDDKAYKLTVDDFVKPFKEISSVNHTLQLLMALNTAKWVSKKEAYVSDISAGNAIFNYISGLSPQEQADMYKKNATREQEKQLQQVGLQKFIEEFRRFVNTHGDNPEQANQYLKNASSALRITGYPEEKIHEAIAIASQDYLSAIQRTNFDYYLKDVPETRKPAAKSSWDKIQEQRKGLQ